MPYLKEYQYYCPRCGNIGFNDYNDTEDICSVCGHKMIESPHEYELTKTYDSQTYTSGFDEAEREYREAIWKERKQRLYDEVISKSDIFDIDLYNRKDEIKKQDFQKFQEDIAHGKAIMTGCDKGNRYGVKCPYCGATNVRKIFGRSLRRFGRQWHCTHCGSDF